MNCNVGKKIYVSTVRQKTFCTFRQIEVIRLFAVRKEINGRPHLSPHLDRNLSNKVGANFESHIYHVSSRHRAEGLIYWHVSTCMRKPSVMLLHRDQVMNYSCAIKWWLDFYVELQLLKHFVEEVLTCMSTVFHDARAKHSLQRSKLVSTRIC